MTDHTDDLAARLDDYADPERHGCSDVGNFAGGYDCECGWSGWYTHLSYPPHRGCMAQYVMAQAAARIRELEQGIDAAVTQLYATHQPEWATETAKAKGLKPWVCVYCGTADGSWPCVTHMVADDLRGLLR